jgi:mRNA-degrading endonuclease RelE of RelBE toxin-antitoxin system
MRIRIADSYKRSARRVPEHIRNRAAEALSCFQDNPRYPGLNFEKLSGFDDTYSIRVTKQYRVLLIRQIDEAGELFSVVDIGTHQVYRR